MRQSGIARDSGAVKQWAFNFEKDEHRFRFIYDDVTALLRQIGHMASDTELPEFTWFDAAYICQKVRQFHRERK